MDINYIILITDSLGTAKRAVDFSIHSEQAHILAIYSVLRLFFSCGINHRIEF